MARTGQAMLRHCPLLTEWRWCRFKDNAGRWHTVEACDGHWADLDAVQRIGPLGSGEDTPANWIGRGVGY